MVFPAAFIKDTIVSPMYVFEKFSQESDNNSLMGLFLGFSALFLWFRYLFLCQYHAAFITMLCSTFEIGYYDVPAMLFLLRIAWAIQDLLYFHMNFGIFFPSSVNMNLCSLHFPVCSLILFLLY